MANKKILIIEDEAVLLEVLQKKLGQEEFTVLSARDGEEGLVKIKQEKPDLILLDLVMPKKDGFEVMEEMQQDRELKKIPVIIISNSGQNVEIERAQEMGARDYLVKTQFDPREVVEKVKKQFGQKIAGFSSPEKDKSQLAKKKILVVEDDKFLRDLMVKKLGEQGFTVLEATDGQAGFKKVNEEKPDLVLLDLVLPGEDGFSVLEKLKGNSLLKDIPVIILSNLGQREDIERGLRLGAADFMIKAHFTPNEIISKIKTKLGL